MSHEESSLASVQPEEPAEGRGSFGEEFLERMAPGVSQGEVARIRAVYARRENFSRRYSKFNPYALYSTQELNSFLVESLRAQGFTSLASLNILDVGCGGGELLRFLLELGAEPARMRGLDAIPERLRRSRALSPNIPVLCADGTTMPFPDGVFDLAFQFTLFTSVLDCNIRKQIAQEILRVLRPSGRLIWYDFIFNNPKNPDVKGIGRSEIRALFPGCRAQFHRITLAPPIGRILAPVSVRLCYFLSAITFLCTHYLCVIEKPLCLKESNLGVQDCSCKCTTGFPLDLGKAA